MMRLTEPIRTARSTLWTRRTRAANSPRFSDSTVVPALGALGAQALALGALGARRCARRARRSARRARAACSTSRAKTTAAAGAPPITEACAPSSATALEARR